MRSFAKELKKLGYIAYSTPHPSMVTGALVAGDPKGLIFLSSPQTCFPNSVWRKDRQHWQHTGIRRSHPTEIAQQKVRSKIHYKLLGSQMGRHLISLFGGGLAPFLEAFHGLPTLERVHSMELRMEGAAVESLDLEKLQKFYNSPHLSSFCKKYLSRNAFIIQALKVERMYFRFYSRSGAKMDLQNQPLKEFLNLNMEGKWNSQEKEELVLDQPMYIGYQLGYFRKMEGRDVLYTATRAKGSKFIFKNGQSFEESYLEENPLQPLDPKDEFKSTSQKF